MDPVVTAASLADKARLSLVIRPQGGLLQGFY